MPTHALTAILPCNDLDASEAFYNRLGFSRPDADERKLVAAIMESEGLPRPKAPADKK